MAMPVFLPEGEYAAALPGAPDAGDYAWVYSLGAARHVIVNYEIILIFQT